MSLIRAMATVGGLTGISRVAGFVRDILTASLLGAGPIADAFFVALKLPNFFRRVTAEGAFSVSFVPVYSETLEKEGVEAADKFASNVFMLMLSGLSLFCLIAMFAMPWIVYGVAPGFHDDALRMNLAIDLSRVTFPYLLAMSLVALLGGALNARGKFAPFAFAPVLFNVSLITALLLSDYFETAGHAMAWGVAAAGALQFLWLFVSAVRSGMAITFKLPRMTDKDKKVLKLMGPGVVGAGVMHVNLFADLIMASFLDQGSISYLYYADRLNQLPLGIIGIAVGTALLPVLSRAIAAEDKEETRGLFNKALSYCMILALPAACALFAFSPLIISTLFERGAFDAVDTQATSMILMAYVMGLPAYVAVKVFSTAHWSRQDTMTPVKIAVISTLCNIALSLALIQIMGAAGIALATGVTGWLQIILHGRALRQLDQFSISTQFYKAVVKVVMCCALMIAGASGVYMFAETWGLVISLTAVVVSGAAIYGLCLMIFGVITTSDIKILLKKKGNSSE